MPRGIYERTTFNKGWFRKGRPAPKTAFKKGNKPFCNKENPPSRESIRKMVETRKKKGNYIPWNTGKKRPPFSEKWRENISKAGKGRKFTVEHKRKMSISAIGKPHDYMKGGKNWNWQGGKSFELYGFDWTKLLRHSIRTRDCFICHICKKNGWVIHHIDYNKRIIILTT